MLKRKDIFVDTGAWYALADNSDQYHGRAIDVYPGFFRDNFHLVTTNLVIAEAYVLIRRAMGHGAAVTFLENIAASPRISKLCSDEVPEKEAERILRQYEDQDFSYTDAVSFAVMRRRGIDRAFSFDRHFVTAGFDIYP